MSLKGWSDLPPELFNRIIHKLYELLSSEAGVVCNIEDPQRLQELEIKHEILLWRLISRAELLRRVCKAWLTAYRDSASLQIVGISRQIRSLVRIAPGTETLIIVDPNDDSMSQISRFLYLRAFHGVGWPDGISLDLSCLPAHVKLLELHYMQFRLDTLQSLKCSEVTQIRLDSLKVSINDVWRLMQQLPKLQVAEIDAEKLRNVKRGLLEPARSLERLTSLTSLRIGVFLLETPLARGGCPCNLQSLYLVCVKMSAQWLDALLQGLHHLRVLEIDGAEVFDKPIDWQPRLPVSLRHLKLLGWSPLNVPLVPLESLAWGPSMAEEYYLDDPDYHAMELAEAQCILAMKSLTRLELQDLTNDENLQHLHHSRLPLLRELEIMQCEGLAMAFLQSGAVPSLEVLSIDGSVDTRNRQELTSWEFVEVEEVDELMMYVFRKVCSSAA